MTTGVGDLVKNSFRTVMVKGQSLIGQKRGKEAEALSIWLPPKSFKGFCHKGK